MPVNAIVNPAHDHATVQPSPRTMRRFGVELEMVAPGNVSAQDHARTIVQSAGQPAIVSRPFGREYHVWQCKSDGSIQPFERGVEIVSRIMPASESSYDEIRRVVGALETAGFGVNRSCGFHCHINVSDLPLRTRQLIILRYAQLQTQIDTMLPLSRRTGANGFCQTLTPSSVAVLARNIDSGDTTFPVMALQGGASYDHYSATNVQWARAQGTTGDGARIEFRQAAATCNAAKVIGWVRFLQEMVDDVARRAATANFGNTSATAFPPPRPVLAPRQVGGVVPNMRGDSDAGRAMTQLCAAGVITAQWTREAGIGDNVMRRIITGFRRHGAAIITHRTVEGPSYVLAGSHALPVSREAVFAPAVVQPAAPPPPVAPPQPARVTAREFVAYPFNEGLSDATVAWCADRRDTFAASNNP